LVALSVPFWNESVPAWPPLTLSSAALLPCVIGPS
jgi:hypothetical protein